MELWDAYNENGESIGKKLVRGEKIPDGVYHIVVEVLVIHEDGSILLMQRDMRKKIYPGLFEASASGSAVAGETSLEGAFRELAEETGIKTSSLDFIQRTRSKTALHDQYICLTDVDKNSIILQEGETIAFKWLFSDEFIEFLNTDNYVREHRERLLSIKPDLISLF